MSSSDSFARSVCKIVIAQISKDLGFEAIQETALESLVDILRKYIEQVGLTSHSYSELASRTETNFHDVRSTFKDMGVSLDDLYIFARVAEDVPFPKAIPDFPQRKVKREENTTSTSPEDATLPPSIPDFMPPFPSTHTYIHTPVYEERLTDPRLIRKTKSKERRQMETSLAKLNEKLGNKPIINYDSARKTATANPYLAPPKTKAESEKESVGLQHSVVTRSEENEAPAVIIPPTPIQSGSQYMKGITMRKMFKPSTDDASGSNLHAEGDNKRVYSEIEESERLKKRQRAEQLLSLQHEGEIMTQELPVPRGTASGTSNNGGSSSGGSSAGNSGGGPFIEKL